MRKLAIMVAAAMTLTGVSRAAEQPKDFAYGLPINAPAGDAFYRLEVPSAVYGKTTRSDLGDLRVFNGADEVVPHAYLPQPPAERVRGTPVDLGLFALTGDAARGVDGVNLRIDSNGARTTISVVSGASNPARAVSARLLGYVLDGSAIDTPLTSLKLRLPESGASLATKVSLEASDDLKSWRNVARDVPIVRLDSVGGAGTLRLVQDEIVFGATKAKYWRLAWLGKPVELPDHVIVPGSRGNLIVRYSHQQMLRNRIFRVGLDPLSPHLPRLLGSCTADQSQPEKPV